MKIKEIVKFWANDKKSQVKMSSFSSYMLLIDNHILPAFGELEELSEDIVQEWIYETIKSKKLSRKSVLDVIICLKMIVKFGAKIEAY